MLKNTVASHTDSSNGFVSGLLVDSSVRRVFVCLFVFLKNCPLQPVCAILQNSLYA